MQKRRRTRYENVFAFCSKESKSGHLVEIYVDRWGEEGIEVMRNNGPQRRSLNIDTGEAEGDPQEVLKARV